MCALKIISDFQIPIYGPPKLTATSFVNTFLSDRLCNMGKFLVEYSTTMQIIC